MLRRWARRIFAVAGTAGDGPSEAEAVPAIDAYSSAGRLSLRIVVSPVTQAEISRPQADSEMLKLPAFR